METILIFYASYGGGHLSAAKSIQNHIVEKCENVAVEMIDCMKYINKPIEKLTTGAYREMAKKTPKLWGKIYSGSQKGLLSVISKDSNKLMAKKLNKLIQERKPNLIISTHPFSSQMCSYLKKKGLINCRLATVMTDFAMHKQWLIGHEFTDYFFVSNKNMKNDMVEYGVNANKIFVTGIPMSNRFFENFDNTKIYEMFNLNPEKKVILFFGGGEFGIGKNQTIQVLKSFISLVPNYQIIAIAGKNEKMKEEFENLVNEYNASNRIRVLGFTDKVPELMHIACLVVTKPGGLTTTETLACGLPMVIINPIPGQEEENAEFLVSNGVAIWIKKDDNLEDVISSLFSSDALEKMKENVKSLSKRNSTEAICKISLENL